MLGSGNNYYVPSTSGHTHPLPRGDSSAKTGEPEGHSYRYS